MTDKDKSEIEVNASQVLKNCSEAFLNKKKERYYAVVAVIVPVVISILALIVAITK
jgi:ribose 1,5-bisphosphokinase PhnN